MLNLYVAQIYMPFKNVWSQRDIWGLNNLCILINIIKTALISKVINLENIVLRLYLIKSDTAKIFNLSLFILKISIKIRKTRNIFENGFRSIFIKIDLFLVYFWINDKIFHELIYLKIISTRL